MVGDDVVSKNNRVKKILADGGHDSKDNFGGPINLRVWQLLVMHIYK